MSHFVFKAKKASGEIYSSERNAADKYELYKLLRESGEEVIFVDEKKEGKRLNLKETLKNIGGKVRTIDKINMARNLGSMLQAGLALSRALSVLERQTKRPAFKKVLQGVIADIDKGTTFSESLGHHDKVFPPLFVSMVHAGEQSGTLAEALKGVSTQMESAYSLERRIRGALMYPAVILVAMLLIGILMFIFVVPTLLKTFTELNVELPFTTRIVLGISTLMQQHGLWVALAFLVLSGLVWWWSKKPSGKKVIHKALIKMPLIGQLVQEVNAARTARTLSSLLSSGVDVVESVNITANVVQNVHFRAVLERAREAIKKGDLMSKVFNEKTDLYPLFFAEMMSVGEETGKMSDMLLGVAKYYEEDVSQRTKDMSTIIEPFLMVIIGAAVGFFAVSMIQPMYSLVDVI